MTAFAYQQTVVLDSGGWIAIDVKAGPDQPLSLSDLSFVVTLAEQCLAYESQRLTARATRLAEEQRAARQRDMPLCWPGIRPSAQGLVFLPPFVRRA